MNIVLELELNTMPDLLFQCIKRTGRTNYVRPVNQKIYLLNLERTYRQVVVCGIVHQYRVEIVGKTGVEIRRIQARGLEREPQIER